MEIKITGTPQELTALIKNLQEQKTDAECVDNQKNHSAVYIREPYSRRFKRIVERV